MSKRMKKDIKILKNVLETLRENGVAIDSPYDFWNWVEDYASDSEKFFETGLFQDLQDE